MLLFLDHLFLRFTEIFFFLDYINVPILYCYSNAISLLAFFVTHIDEAIYLFGSIYNSI